MKKNDIISIVITIASVVGMTALIHYHYYWLMVLLVIVEAVILYMIWQADKTKV